MPTQGTPLAPGGNEIELLCASWPEIVTVQRGTPQSFDGKVLRIMFDAEGNLMNFPRFEDDPRRAVQQATGTGWDVVPPPTTVALAQME